MQCCRVGHCIDENIKSSRNFVGRADGMGSVPVQLDTLIFSCWVTSLSLYVFDHILASYMCVCVCVYMSETLEKNQTSFLSLSFSSISPFTFFRTSYGDIIN